jgi:hypothetical protein
MLADGSTGDSSAPQAAPTPTPAPPQAGPGKSGVWPPPSSQQIGNPVALRAPMREKATYGITRKRIVTVTPYDSQAEEDETKNGNQTPLRQ